VSIRLSGPHTAIRSVGGLQVGQKAYVCVHCSPISRWSWCVPFLPSSGGRLRVGALGRALAQRLANSRGCSIAGVVPSVVDGECGGVSLEVRREGRSGCGIFPSQQAVHPGDSVTVRLSADHPPSDQCRLITFEVLPGTGDALSLSQLVKRGVPFVWTVPPHSVHGCVYAVRVVGRDDLGSAALCVRAPPTCGVDLPREPFGSAPANSPRTKASTPVSREKLPRERQGVVAMSTPLSRGSRSPFRPPSEAEPDSDSDSDLSCQGPDWVLRGGQSSIGAATRAAYKSPSVDSTPPTTGRVRARAAALQSPSATTGRVSERRGGSAPVRIHSLDHALSRRRFPSKREAVVAPCRDEDEADEDELEQARRSLELALEHEARAMETRQKRSKARKMRAAPPLPQVAVAPSLPPAASTTVSATEAATPPMPPPTAASRPPASTPADLAAPPSPTKHSCASVPPDPSTLPIPSGLECVDRAFLAQRHQRVLRRAAVVLRVVVR
jgi:hypothetical protein